MDLVFGVVVIIAIGCMIIIPIGKMLCEQIDFGSKS